jgi:hypothetical protein
MASLVSRVQPAENVNEILSTSAAQSKNITLRKDSTTRGRGQWGNEKYFAFTHQINVFSV